MYLTHIDVDKTFRNYINETKATRYSILIRKVSPFYDVCSNRSFNWSPI